MSAWQWSNLAATLDPWLESEPAAGIREAVLHRLVSLAEQSGDGGLSVEGVASPLVREVVVQGRVRLTYLIAEQFRTLRLIEITSL